MHRAAESPSDPEYLDFFFAVKSWAGHPAVGEPVKCSELVWVSQSRLASDVIDYVRAALEAIASGTALVWHGW